MLSVPAPLLGATDSEIQDVHSLGVGDKNVSIDTKLLIANIVDAPGTSRDP